MLSRRDFLRSAGGITLLALDPIDDRLFAAPTPPDGPQLPLFTVVPYIQPGPRSRLTDGDESMVVAWQTLEGAGDFSVDFGSSERFGRSARCERAARASGHSGDGERRINWTAAIDGLPLAQKTFYRVRGNGVTLAEGYFTTRQPRGRRIRFVSFGDNSYGDLSDRAIAFHTYRQHPDFVMNCGDNVYESGTDDEYQRYFFPVYNADAAGQRLGAPLLRSVPFYTVIANHDVQGKDENGHEIADFGRSPDALAYYTAMHLPLNGPDAPTHPTPTTVPRQRVDPRRSSFATGSFSASRSRSASLLSATAAPTSLNAADGNRWSRSSVSIITASTSSSRTTPNRLVTFLRRAPSVRAASACSSRIGSSSRRRRDATRVW